FVSRAPAYPRRPLRPLRSFFFDVPATAEISPLSLHDALPILRSAPCPPPRRPGGRAPRAGAAPAPASPFPPRSARPSPSGRGSQDRKSTRLNSSHVKISYAVFCLKKKKNKHTPRTPSPTWLVR